MPDLSTNPFPLGRVTVAAAGTPVSILANFPTFTGNADNGKDLYCNKLIIWGLPSLPSVPFAGNTGNVYVGSKTMNKVTLAGVIAIVPPGGSFTLQHDVGMNKYHVGDFWVDVDTNGEGCYATADVV